MLPLCSQLWCIYLSHTCLVGTRIMNGLLDKFQLSAGKEQMPFSGKGFSTVFWGLALLLLIAGTSFWPLFTLFTKVSTKKGKLISADISPLNLQKDINKGTRLRPSLKFIENTEMWTPLCPCNWLQKSCASFLFHRHSSATLRITLQLQRIF